MVQQYNFANLTEPVVGGYADLVPVERMKFSESENMGEGNSERAIADHFGKFIIATWHL
jgi:hypothetical protein